MKCPVCKKEMPIDLEDTSFNDKDGKQYKRTLYHCAECDTWIKVEVPKNEI